MQKTSEDIVARCASVEPHHGEDWCRVSKAIPNWRLKTGEILRLASTDMAAPT